MEKLTRSDLCSKITLTRGTGRDYGGMEGQAGRPLCNRMRGDDSLEDGCEEGRGRQAQGIFSRKTCGGKERQLATEAPLENNLIMNLK